MNIKKLINAAILAVFMATAFGCATSETQRSPGDYVDDSWITTKVKSSLIKEDDTKARDIQVETFNGVVQLSGFVDDASQKAHAVSIAKGIKGVKSVKDDLQIRNK